jgi:formiminotetrahydrofolate cyclodeaminase
MDTQNDISTIDMLYLANKVLSKGNGDGWSDMDSSMRLARMAIEAAETIDILRNQLEDARQRMTNFQSALKSISSEISILIDTPS